MALSVFLIAVLSYALSLVDVCGLVSRLAFKDPVPADARVDYFFLYRHHKCRAREEFDSEEGKALLKKWGIEGDYIGVGHCILGYPDGEYREAKPRKDNYVYRV